MKQCLSIMLTLGLLCLSLSSVQAQDKLAPAWLNPDGMTVETRFVPPTGYVRKQYEDPYTDYMRKLPMMPDGSPVYIYDGSLKQTQNHHVGVLDVSVGDRDLQQCSDAAQRLRTDYLYQTKQYDKISYHFVNGMELSWNKWREGWRVKRENKKTVMVKSAKAGDTEEVFRNYQKWLFIYAGVSSVMKESPKITIKDLQPGDVIAATGHLIIVLDVVENEQGEKRFLLAQSYIPAQQIEVLKNTYSDNPWYDAKHLESCPFITPEWTYDCPGPAIYRLL